jgi:hypothetical protein
MLQHAINAVSRPAPCIPTRIPTSGWNGTFSADRMDTKPQVLDVEGLTGRFGTHS